jgi:hypothetical protein
MARSTRGSSSVPAWSRVGFGAHAHMICRLSFFRFHFGFRYGPRRDGHGMWPAGGPCGVAASDDVRRQRRCGGSAGQELNGKLRVRRTGSGPLSVLSLTRPLLLRFGPSEQSLPFLHAAVRVQFFPGAGLGRRTWPASPATSVPSAAAPGGAGRGRHSAGPSVNASPATKVHGKPQGSVIASLDWMHALPAKKLIRPTN